MKDNLDILFVIPYPPSILKPRSMSFISLLAEQKNVGVAYLELPTTGYGSTYTDLQESAYRSLQALQIQMYPLSLSLPRALISVARSPLRNVSMRACVFDQPALAKRVAEICESTRPAVVHVDRLRAVPLVSLISTPVVVDLTDPLGIAESVRAECATIPLEKTLRQHQAELIWKDELRVAEKYPVLFASEMGADKFRERATHAKIHVVPNPIVPAHGSRSARHSEQSTDMIRLCFSGNLSYWPNVAGITYFLKHIWPGIQQSGLHVTLTLLGSRPAPKLVKLARCHGVDIVANPIDIYSSLRRFDLAIAPLRFCGGFPNKVVDALIGAAIPVIASPAAIAGLPASVAKMIPIAETPVEWVTALQNFYQNRAIWSERVKCLSQTFNETFSASSIAGALLLAYKHAAATSAESLHERLDIAPEGTQ